MAYTAADYLELLQNLLPTGPVWPRDPSSIQSQVLASLVPNYARLAARDAGLLIDAFPSTTVELLPEWEETLGLPDPCAGEAPTISQRQAQVVARFTDGGGQSVQHFVDYAATLGFAITITEFAPRTFGQRFGQPMNGEAWAFAWQVNTAALVVDPREFGISRFGEPYATWGSGVLQCELRRLAPAHTVLLFAYSGPGSASPLGSFVLGRDTLGASA